MRYEANLYSGDEWLAHVTGHTPRATLLRARRQAHALALQRGVAIKYTLGARTEWVLPIPGRIKVVGGGGEAPMTQDAYYYHAGVTYSDGGAYWSDRTRRTRAAAEREARRLARECGGSPVVEYWRRDWGLRPRCADAVVDAYVVEG